MIKKILPIALLLLSGFYFQHAVALDFSAEGMKHLSAPTGHVPGKDNGPGKGTHFAGENCAKCHKPGGKSPNHVFTISGTLYEDRAARKPLNGGEVILQDVNGKAISMTTNATGNFWTYEPVGSNPYTVIGKGVGLPLYSYNTQGNFIPADPTAPQTWQYKAWVKYGDHLISMVTIAPVGGATLLSDGTPDKNSRMSCNMHHAPLGSRGGLWVSAKSSIFSYPQSGLSYKKHILPIFRNKCVPCHIPGETWTRIVTKTDMDTPGTKVNYSANLDLTTYNGSSVTVSGDTWTKKGVASVVTTGNPDASLLLTKTKQSGLAHAGGWFWTENNPDCKVIRQWIAEGSQNN